VTRAAAAIPAATLATSGYGLITSQGSVRMPEIPLNFAGLHPDLRGLRVLHLSDIHLGYYVGLDNLEELMSAAKNKRPDLVLVSGDIADDLAQLPGALRMIDSLRPRYGTFASLGNHEYFRGIENVVKIIDAGPIPLLRGTGAAVKIGRAELYVGGADDPVMMAHGERNHRFLQDSVGAAFDGAPSDAFHILMSHRPEGFDVASEQGIELTVSGHTHGAQVGFNGRSILEPWMRDRYLWGHYQREGSQLYTSSGVGHWFPFRLGCPPEAPVYVLGGGRTLEG
jgi:predicted MPP superfamily phosphohydrolase